MKHNTYQKGIALAVIVLFVSVSVIPSTGTTDVKQITLPTNSGVTLYVGGSGPGNYTKIQDAIDNAHNGCTVFVYNGTYYENVYIDREINLIGENKYTTIIDGRKGSLFVEVIRFAENNVRLSGFTIQNSCPGSGSGGIDLKYHSNNIIEGNIIYNNTNGFGIEISKSWNGKSKDNIITNNIITNNNVGISIDGTGTSGQINNNIITNNTITNNNVGIRLHKSYWITVKSNNITNNLNVGLIVSFSERNLILINNFIGNKKNADFVYSRAIAWDSNYWDNWNGNGPKIIFGSLGPFGIIPWINFDWFPAKEPYDMGV